MGITIVVILLLLGIIFFLIELFLIPGISLAGIAGMLFVGGAVFYAYSYIGSTAGHLTLVGAFILLGMAIWVFLRSKALDKMSLKTEIDGKNDPLKDVEIHVGDKGKAVSRLAPMGKVKINGHVVEAKTNDEFIDQDSEVEVLEVYKTNVLVAKIN
ncbi:MAG: NfeD family protein [Paludibacter sp.]|nr:NfeD family protein [Paludibacter sp.]